MREVIRDIFAGARALFTGKFLASFAMIPVFFASIGATFPDVSTNIVDESAIYDSASAVEVEKPEEVKEPNAGNNNPTFAANAKKPRQTPVDIVDSASIKYDLMIAGKVATSVVNVGLDKGAVAVPNSSAGYYNANGAHLLVGHNTGVFAGLIRASTGDVVKFRGENYAIYASKIYNYDPSVGVYDGSGEMNNNGKMMYDSLYNGGAAGLNLMTCHGSYLPSFGTYNQRLVVFARKI